VGWNFHTLGVTFGPSLRYEHVVQPASELDSSDAQIVLAGLEVVLHDAHDTQAPPPETTPPAASVELAKISDRDGDGIPDELDKCPDEPEDKDGFEDEDGCPDPDNDHDGIPDDKDKCPNEPETVNGVADEDGCPDSGGVVLVHFEGDRLTVDRVPALAGGRLSRGGEIIVDEMSLVMRGHAEVTKWLIAIGMPKAPDAKRLGDAVRTRLIAKGVPADRVELLTAAGPAKIGGLVRARVDADAPPACPAGLAIPRPEATRPRVPVPAATQPN